MVPAPLPSFDPDRFNLLRAFLRGFRQLVPLSWMRMFGAPELQLLLGGASDGAVDLGDLRRNTTYSGGFDDAHPLALGYHH